MNIVPTKKLTLTSKLSAEALRLRLESKTDHKRKIEFRLFQKFDKPYHGEINKTRFRILRNLTGRNSFQAIVSGEFEEEIGQSKIKIMMHTHAAIKIFMIIWLTGISTFCILTLSILLFDNQKFEIFHIIPFFMLIFGIFLPKLGFKPDSSKFTRELTELFEAKVINEEGRSI